MRTLHNTIIIILCENFCWIKISPSPATFVLQEKFVQFFNTGQKISMIKFSPMRAGGESGEILSW